jgi:hypothetical protein
VGHVKNMSADGDADTTRTSVKVYVPAYQKDVWAADAERLGMSQSEYVRTMVQAGRRGFEGNSKDDERTTNLEGVSPDATPGVEGLETRVLDVLSEEPHLDWDELVERLAGDFEDRLDDALGQLQEENRVQYSGRHGGYALVSE